MPTIAERRNFDLAAALEEAEDRFRAVNPKSEAAYETAGRSMPGGEPEL